MLHKRLSLLLGIAVDAEARIYLKPLPNSGIKSIRGQLIGPHSQYAHTLPATLPIRTTTSQQNESTLAEVFIPDPCFWTPQLPFLYKLQLELVNEAGESEEFETNIALKRWHVEQANWKLEGKRVVLRGAKASHINAHQLPELRQSEVMLITQPPEDRILQDASNLGVPILADFSLLNSNLEQQIQNLAWCPAIVAALFKAEQIEANPSLADLSSGRFPIGVLTQSGETNEPAIGCDFIAVETPRGQQPPGWLNSTSKPAVIISTPDSQADIPAIRSACDKLQAELAPQFDLAGYFVTI